MGNFILLSATERSRCETKKDIEILRKFSEEREVKNNEEHEILRKYENQGIVRIYLKSFKWRKTFAVLTERGRGLLGVKN